MKKTLCLCLVTLLATTITSAQILYKISGKDLVKPSYILGTYHLADAAFASQIPGCEGIIDKVDQVCGELPMQNIMQPDSIALLQSYMLLPENQTIRDVLTPEEFARLDDLYLGLVGVQFSNPMVYSAMSHLSPAAISNTLTLILALQQQPQPFNPENSIDNYFQRLALETGKPAIGFENITFQAQTLFGSKSTERQVEELMCLVDNIEYYKQYLQKMYAAYTDQDLDGIKLCLDQKSSDLCDATPEEKATLITNRNKNWMRQIPTIMTAHPTLFVVGAGHLVDDEGLLNLMRQKGYTVEGVK